MARRGGGLTQRQALQPRIHGHANGHFPPPSTIPAQIVRGAASVRTQQDILNKQPFIELVKEFLSNPVLEDPDPVCIAFILAITEGGVDPFFKEDPFASKHLEEQGTQCIAALIIIFQQKPHLLFSPTHVEEEHGTPCPPVIIWLFSKLLGLLVEQGLLNIHTIVLELLNTCLKSFTRSTTKLRQAQSIFQLYSSCVESIIVSAEPTEETLETFSPSIKVTLPCSDSIGAIWPESQHLVALPQGLQRTVTSPINATYLGFRLLETIVDCCFSPPQKVVKYSAFESWNPWAVNSCLDLWGCFTSWTVGADRGPLDDDVEALYMQSLSILALPDLDHFDDEFTCSSNSLVAFTSGIIDAVRTCLSKPFSQANQARLAYVLIRLQGVVQDALKEERTDEVISLRATSRSKLEKLITDAMTPGMAEMCHDVQQLTTLDRDLQLSICLWTSPGDWPDVVQELRLVLCSDTEQTFENDELNELSTEVVDSFRSANKPHAEPPAKRRKTAAGPSESTPTDLLNHLVVLLNGSSESPVLHLENFHVLVQSKYTLLPEDPQASDQEQSEMLLVLGKIACAGTQCLQTNDTDEQQWKNATCILCDGTGSEREAETAWNQQALGEMWKDVIAGLIAITQEEKFQQSSRPRVLMAVAIGRIFNHISDSEYLSLGVSPIGEWLLVSMQRSLRELRIAASRSLMTFLRDDISRHVRDKNRRQTMQFLAELTRRNVPAQQETLIMAYGQAARTCSGEELHIILGQLVEYLGHTNTVIYGAAYNELCFLADDLHTSPQELLRPYWKTIGFSIVNDLDTNPQKAKLVVELIGEISYVSQLLILIHEDVLPVLVLNKRTDVLQRIANAKKMSIEEICLQPRAHLARIIALLLCQPGADVERRAMDTLVAVAPGLQQTRQKLHDLVQLDAAAMASEVFKLAADRDADEKALFYEGIRRLATLDDVKSDLDSKKQKDGKRKAIPRKKTKDLVETFILKHVLGVMADFTNPIENQLGNHHLTERRRCVGAIRELITFAREDSCHALTQIRACLQSAMADSHLCDQAFDVWSLLLTVLEETHLGLVLGQTFALIVHNWSSFSDDIRLKASASLELLRTQHNQLLQSHIGQLASLSSIPMLKKLETEISRLKSRKDPITLLNYMSERCNDENSVVVQHALKELVPFLEEHQKLLHQSAIDQKPLPALITLSRSLLDICVRFPGHHVELRSLCAQCLGLVGGLDPYRVETVREKKQVLVLHNFEQAAEVIQFVAFMLEEVLVKVFLSTTNARSQGWLAWLMQELCKLCGFNNMTEPGRASQSSQVTQRWEEFPEPVQKILTPFLDSKYRFTTNEEVPTAQYPIFSMEISHATWLRTFTYDILQKAKVQNAKLFFPTIGRVARREDLSIASFILPYAVLSVVVGGDETDVSNVGLELLAVLQTDLQGLDHTEAMNVKQCSENVFQVLDYLTLWLQEKRRAMSDARIMARKTGRGISEDEEIEAMKQFSAVEQLLQLIPAKIISKRSVECGSYARALFHWEQYYREEQQKSETAGGVFIKDEMLQHLQHIYAQIDEPDSIEGISAHLLVLNPEQQIMEHRKAGRWTAAQTWYELALADKPNDPETQVNLLTCLKESGQYDAVLNYVDGFHAAHFVSSSTLPFAVEAAWSTGKWDQLERILTEPSGQLAASSDFNIGIGKALLALRHDKADDFTQTVNELRVVLSNGLSASVTASLHNSHDHLVKLHTLYELETISGFSKHVPLDRDVLFENLDRRLDLLGAYTSDKQYLLGVRRAVMQLSRLGFTNLDVASAWLTTARLARKGDFSSAAFNSIMHASQLGGEASKIEYSKMLWKEGHYRKAIQNLRGALVTNSFGNTDMPHKSITSVSTSTTMNEVMQHANRTKCHAQLLLAKWLDRAGQTQSGLIKEEYARGIMTYPRWDKGHYYLGRYYLKLYETEKALPPVKQSSIFLAGELTKLIIENYIRSTVYGAKYFYQSIPKILTLWLDMGMEMVNPQPRISKDKDLYQHKVKHLDHINGYVKRYASERMPAYPWYTAFPQIITRISHPNKNVWEVLQLIIIKVTAQYPQQALWGLLAVQNSQQDDRRARGAVILTKLRNHNKPKNGTIDIKNLIVHGQRLADALLSACDTPVEQRVSHVSLSRDLRFNTKLAPCNLVVPIEASMTPSLPSTNDSRLIRAHNPFPSDMVTISEFKDDVLVLASLQRPRKITVRGSDGRSYGLLCKPKDDLRKDQRLMEFNAMINRALTKNIEASKRRLYIKTYAVTPLNEECGTIEWVEGLKPMRDIIIRLYRQKNVNIDYQEIRLLLDQACSDPKNIDIFTDNILARFKPVLYEWFVETFPEPEAWFAARLRYTRSCAVMSIVGHVLGLGDRHGENVLLEEGNGGTFHVDFNCLFDKGLTFEKPELVPFRLTHNMVDAMGPAGIEGPFRKTAELIYSLLRQHEDALITILETFVHDPTADFVGAKKKKRVPGVPESPQEVLEIVKGKLGGFVRGDSVPLSVEGYVDSLLRQARDPMNLASMYIGWCAFF